MLFLIYFLLLSIFLLSSYLSQCHTSLAFNHHNDDDHNGGDDDKDHGYHKDRDGRKAWKGDG